MPRHDWRDDDTMSRDRGYSDYDDRGRSGAFFRDDRGPQMRNRSGGWGSLMGDESSGGRRMSERGDSRGDRRFGPDDERDGVPRDETERLIASNKVEGTPVYDRNGDRLGSVHNFMVDKFRGRVVYAVLNYGGGFLGLDDRYYPLDWDQLTFDTRLGGYRIDMTEGQLKGLGSWDRNERWSDRPSMRRDRDSGREHDRSHERSDRVPW